MTTTEPRPTQCAACGKMSAHFELASSTEFGPPDLDLRPGEMYRSTISQWVHRCPHCGFCSEDISEATPEAAEIANSESYRSQLNDPRFSELSNTFLCSALLEEAIGNLQSAGWEALRAAWVMDDEQNATAAIACRLRAIDMFARDFAARRHSLKKPAAYYALLIDLHRRAERFNTAHSLLLEGRRLELQDTEQRVFDIQDELIANRDTRCYTSSGRLRDG